MTGVQGTMRRATFVLPFLLLACDEPRVDRRGPPPVDGSTEGAQAEKRGRLREERVDAAYARCLVRFGQGTCALIEQHGLRRCHRPGLHSDKVARCVEERLEVEHDETYTDDCYPHVVGCPVGNETPSQVRAEMEEGG